jgi:hypothetical protein
MLEAAFADGTNANEKRRTQENSTQRNFFIFFSPFIFDIWLNFNRFSYYFQEEMQIS